MPRAIPPQLSLALTYLRTARGWTQQDLASAAGVSSQVVCDYEKGTRRTLPRQTLEELVARMGYAPEDVTLALLFLGGLSPAEQEQRWSPEDPSPAEVRRARRIAARTGLTETSRLYAQLLDLGRARRVEQARLRAARQWEALRRLTPAQRLELVERSPGLQHWGLVELLCVESVRAAADRAESALELARLALRVAELAPGEEAWRSRLRGYAWAFVANAQRVASDLVAAEASFATAWRLWRASGAAARGPLGAWRLHDLEASLRRDQRQFTAALDCLERALAAAPVEARGRILLKKAYTLEQADQIEGALATLEDAATLVDCAGEPRLRWGVELNRTLILARLGHHEEAEARLPALSELTLELGNRLDLARMLWVSGRVAAGLGKREEARAAFDQAKREFEEEDANAYDTALVSLDVAILLLEEGRTAEVAVLAEQMLAIFRSRRVSREALAALRLFYQAAQAGRATAAEARRLLGLLEEARRREPTLGSEDGG
jgi:tetratricopeptide (TPR) repeat protein/DNA-binding XRE family transcriptional regulator